MAFVQQVLVDHTDTLIFYPPLDLAGQASAAVCRIKTPSTSLPDDGTTQAMTVDSVSASTNAASDEGDTSLAFASDPTCTAGRKYLLTNTVGRKAYVEVLVSGATTYLASPLPFDCASGSTLVGVALTVALTSAQSDDVGPGLCKIEATINSVVHQWDKKFEIVWAIFANPVDAENLIDLAPVVRRMRPPEDQDLSDAIEAGWLWMLPRLQARGIHIERINSPSALMIPIVASTVLHLARQMGNDWARGIIEEWTPVFDNALNDALSGVKFWYHETADTEDDGTGETVEARTIMVTR